MDSLSDRERFLVDAARQAKAYFARPLGQRLQGMYDDICIGRALVEALAQYEDVPDPRDVRQEVTR